jgi:hypothetical protein
MTLSYIILRVHVRQNVYFTRAKFVIIICFCACIFMPYNIPLIHILTQEYWPTEDTICRGGNNWSEPKFTLPWRNTSIQKKYVS